MSDNKNYRVRIAIYDMDEGSANDAIHWTDEPLYSHLDEINVQAQRTQRYFLQKTSRAELV